MILSDLPPPPPPLRRAIREAYRLDETAALEAAALPPDTLDRIGAIDRALVAEVRRSRVTLGSTS